ncbi:cytochrome c3 family protein, partial [bacterium]|nr:cytochrome c3 family protein [bacterium]
MKTQDTLPRKKLIIPAIVVLCVALVLSFYQVLPDSRSPIDETTDIPLVMGHREGCFLCHQKVSGFSKSHDPQALGCSSCHLGNPLSPDKDKAHIGIVKVPGNLDTAVETCGQSACHRNLTHKVSTSLMASGKGVVSVDRYVFGETYSPDGPGHLSHLTDSAADTHLRQLCVPCHLSFPKTQSAAIDQESRGGGCTACHLEYSTEAKLQLSVYHKNQQLPQLHPSLSVNVNNDKCFGCHSRSARISLNYEGWFETELKPKNLETSKKHRILQDQRVLEYKGADVHYQRGMVCIDCHTARDMMGDGTAYNHQEEQVEISCVDCHAKKTGASVSYTGLDEDSVKILKLREQTNREKLNFITTQKTDRPLINIFLDQNQSPIFKGKLDGKLRELKAPAKECSDISGHERLTCQTCHTQWAPTCIKCHTQYESKKKRKDHYTGEKIQGAWKEYKGELLALPPALGVRLDKNRNQELVDTFIPGMVLTIGGIKDNKPDKTTSYSKKSQNYTLFRRLFAPTFSHTIQKTARSCRSCHQDPRALGLGEGLIEYQKDGESVDEFSM